MILKQNRCILFQLDPRLVAQADIAESGFLGDDALGASERVLAVHTDGGRRTQIRLILGLGSSSFLQPDLPLGISESA